MPEPADIGLSRYPHLFSPLRIGALELANRFAMAPMTTNYANLDGSVTPELCDYLALRGAGGFGLVVTENIGVHPSGRVMPRMVMGHDDALIPGLTQLARAVQATGAKIIGQLSHCGRQSKSKFTGHPLVAASPIPCPLNREIPLELSIDQIGAMEESFIAAAVRIEQAGYDGVEVHSAHGYLPSGFLSAYSNVRTDIYGGPLENRMRFLLNIVDGIKRRTALPLTVRISADEFVKGGNTLEQTTVIASALEARGVDAISVSVGVYESFNTQSMVTGEDEGRWLPIAAQIKQVVKVPVFAVGRIKRPDVAERAVADGACDIPFFGRAAVADPALPNKTRRGAEHRIVYCLSCNICLGRASRPETICPVNPGVGHDRAFAAMLEERSPEPKRVAIVGSSLSATTAAWIAARRGHTVIVYEPDAARGGMQAWRARVPQQGEYEETVRAAEQRAFDAGVRFAAGTPARGTFDVVWIVRRYQPVNARDDAYAVLAGADASRDDERCTVIGQDLPSAEAALVLAALGTNVTLRSPGVDIALDAHPGYRALNRRLLEAKGAAISVKAALDGAPGDARVVLGHPVDPAIAYGSPDGWVYPYGQAMMGRPADAFIDDAYEPGLMTRGIYAAVALARAA